MSPCPSISDLLCTENNAGIFDQEFCSYSSDPVFPIEDLEQYIEELIEEEEDYMPEFDYRSKLLQSESVSIDSSSARNESISWIHKVCTFYRFHPLTAYLSVNYMDRFLSVNNLPLGNGWPLKLLSVTCLSLAAKMEEPIVPSLFDLQVKSAKYLFEPKSIQRMEFIVLTTLDWRLRSITPFNFIDFFAHKIDASGTFSKFLISQATKLILASIKGIKFINYPPSSMAAAAILTAAKEIPNLCLIGSSSLLCKGLSKGKMLSCYKLMEGVIQKRPPKVLPQLRVTTRAWIGSIDSSSSNSSSPSSSSSSSSSSNHKRRKINNTFWVSDEDDDSDRGNSN